MKKSCPDEYPISLFINQQEIAVFQLSNCDLEDWVCGYLFSEGFITSMNDVISLEVFSDKLAIRVSITNDIERILTDKKKHYTSGCGRGVTFFSMTDVKTFSQVHCTRKYQLSYLLKKRASFAQNSPMYIASGGMHGACLLFPDGSFVVREDIGRHNAVDKVIGYAVRNHIARRELVLMTTGRISYEMLSKAAKFGFPVVASKTAATKQALQLAKFLNVEVVGYLRSKDALIYTQIGRVSNDLV